MQNYEEIILSLVDKFSRSIEEEKDCEILTINFEKYLRMSLSNLSNTNYSFSNTTDYIKKILLQQTEEMISLNIDKKMAKLLEDRSFDNLIELSNVIFNNALSKYNGNPIIISDEEYNETLKRLKKTLNEIKKYNFDEASELYSESILDLQYVFNDSDITSLRIGRVLEKNNNSKLSNKN